MTDPVFTPEAPPPVAKKRGLSNSMKIALGCGITFLLGLGTCFGGVMYCGHKVSSMGSQQWAELRQVAGDLGTDAGAKAVYASHPGLAAAYPTADDFLDETKQWRPSLEPLPEQMPSLMSGKITMSNHYNNGFSTVTLGYQLASGRKLVGTWHNATLANLELE